MKPTTEQQAIVNGIETNNVMKVNACAGSGKTSTVILMANQDSRPSLYLAFNKKMADEAKTKLPNHVTSRTTHSLAYAKFGRMLQSKLSRPRGKYVNVAGTPSEIGKYYSLNMEGVPSNIIGLLVKKSVANFQSSADMTLGSHHLPRKMIETVANEAEVDEELLRAIVSAGATKLWKDRTDVSSRVLADHDTYLKLYQLSKPNLSQYAVIYLDEGQDSTDVVLDIVFSQNEPKKVIVGDNRQNIYGWRGAVNALSKVEAETFVLSKSFRYGQVVADIGTAIIGGDIEITGNELIDSKVGTIDTSKQFAKLFRTNSALLMDAIGFIDMGLKVAVEIDTRDFLKMMDSTVALMNRDMKNVKHDSIIPYQNFSELLEAAKLEPELARMAKIVINHDPAEFKRKLEQTTNRAEDADVILTTAHKSKGREFDQVVLANDFPEYEDVADIGFAEANLLYVAATRAVKVLQINGLVDMILRSYYSEDKYEELVYGEESSSTSLVA